MSTPERAGWYDDPEDESLLRYFDGIIWSDRTVPKRTREPQPPAAQPVPGQTPGAGAPGTDVFGRPTVAPTPPGVGAPHTPYQGHAPQVPVERAPEPTTADGQQLAGFGLRVVAYLIDIMVVGALNLLVTGWAWWLWFADYWRFAYDAAISGNQAAVNELTPDELMSMLDWKYFFIALGLGLLVQAIYHIGFLTTRSATPGKMALKLSVRRLDRPGRLSVGTAFMRILLPLAIGVTSVVPFLGYLLGFIGIADLLWPIKDPKRQALHDKIAGTVVVVGRQDGR